MVEDRASRFAEYIGSMAQPIALPGGEEALAALFHVLLETAPDAMFVVDDQRRVFLINAEAERIFDFRRDAVIGTSIDDLLSDSLRAANPQQYGPDATLLRRSLLEFTCQRRDGSTFPAEISLRAIRLEDRSYLTVAVRDVTERVELERERREREREAAEHRADRMSSLGQMAGGVAHDFNTLLGIILNYAGFLARQLGDESPLLDDVEQIRRAADRAARLTHQLLAFSRREVTHPVVVDLGVVLADTGRLLHRTIGEHVDVDVQAPADLWPVLADAAHLEQLVLNLALNARDAMPAGGTISLDAANVDVPAALTPNPLDVVPGRHVRFRVRDTGTGMDEPTRTKAFEPFFTTKPVGSGTGLGLAMAYGAVKQAGGDIRIDSTLGEGTTVTVHLPAVDAVDPVESAPPAAPGGGGETVLVVEDELAFQELTRRILDHSGYDVLVASDGFEALEVLASRTDVDLVLSDIMMPGMAGTDLARRIHELDPTLPVLLMSGNAGPEVGDLLGKPFTPPELLRRVREVLDR